MGELWQLPCNSLNFGTDTCACHKLESPSVLQVSVNPVVSFGIPHKVAQFDRMEPLKRHMLRCAESNGTCSAILVQLLDPVIFRNTILELMLLLNRQGERAVNPDATSCNQLNLSSVSVSVLVTE